MSQDAPASAISGRWTIPVTMTGHLVKDRYAPHDGDQMVPVVPCDDAAVERVARVLCRQRGYSWDDAGDGLRAALVAAADQALRAAGGHDAYAT